MPPSSFHRHYWHSGSESGTESGTETLAVWDSAVLRVRRRARRVHFEIKFLRAVTTRSRKKHAVNWRETPFAPRQNWAPVQPRQQI